MGPRDLAQVLRHLSDAGETLPAKNPSLLVGYDTSDDAGVFRIAPDVALVQTLDFFTPVVDDPYLFGQVAASNALSDIYAMGAKPLTAMNIVCFPCSLDMGILAEILKGGASKVQEAGAELLGGHTVVDNEPKYGLSVTGVVHPARVVSNAKAQVGDKLVLTKPIGNGIVMTAAKNDQIDAAAAEEAVNCMTQLNKVAADAMLEFGANSCTDITGFGFLGHGYEMASASHVQFRIAADAVPLLDAVTTLAQMGIGPGGGMENWMFFEENVSFAGGIPDFMKRILFDPQTSGGLLISVRGDRASGLVSRLQGTGHQKAAVIGEVMGAGGDKPAILIE